MRVLFIEMGTHYAVPGGVTYQNNAVHDNRFGLHNLSLSYLEGTLQIC
jgi:hypothetical protein